MLPAFVFFFALYFSWVLYVNKNEKNGSMTDIIADQITRIVVFGLWTYFWYLMH